MTDSEKVIKLSKNVIEIRTYIKDQIIRLSDKSDSDEINEDVLCKLNDLV